MDMAMKKELQVLIILHCFLCTFLSLR